MHTRKTDNRPADRHLAVRSAVQSVFDEHLARHRRHEHVGRRRNDERKRLGVELIVRVFPPPPAGMVLMGNLTVSVRFR